MFFLSFYLLGVFSSTSNGNYLDYLFSLNYWSSNTLLILSFVFFFQRFQSNIIYSLFFKFFVGYKLMQTYIVKKTLVDALFIGTLTIHPFLFYVSLIVLCFKVLFSRNFYLLGWQVLHFSKLVVLLSVTLLLGGFWGFQSTIWGYFWVNDTVEWLLLVAIIYSLWCIHKSVFCFKSWNFLWVLFFLLNLILLVRLNLISTRHNFIQNSNMSLVVFFFYLAFLFCIAVVEIRRSNLRIYPLALCICVTFYNSLLFFKSFCWLYLLFFLVKSNYKMFLRKFYMHFVVFVFFAIWNIYFTYFYILYGQVQNLYTYFLVGLDHLAICSKQFVTNPPYRDLEGVTFSTFTDTFRMFCFTFDTTCFVVLNNFTLTIFVFFYFLL